MASANFRWSAESSTTSMVWPAPHGERLRWAIRFRRHHCDICRQIHFEDRALTLLAPHGNMPLMILDGPPDNRHPQSRATAAHHFFGVKRLENAVDIGRANADAGIADTQGKDRALGAIGEIRATVPAAMHWQSKSLPRPPSGMASTALETRFMTVLER